MHLSACAFMDKLVYMREQTCVSNAFITEDKGFITGDLINTFITRDKLVNANTLHLVADRYRVSSLALVLPRHMASESYAM